MHIISLKKSANSLEMKVAELLKTNEETMTKNDTSKKELEVKFLIMKDALQSDFKKEEITRNSLEADLKSKEKIIVEKEKFIENFSQRIALMEESNASMTIKLSDATTTIDDYKRVNDSLKSDMRSKLEEIKNLLEKVGALNKLIADLKLENEKNVNAQLSQANKAEKADERILSLYNKINDQEDTITSLEKAQVAKSVQVEELQNSMKVSDEAKRILELECSRLKQNFRFRF